MKTEFKDVIILDWYDNIVNSFCINKEDIIFYCNLLAIDEMDTKIYVCIELKYFSSQKDILKIIQSNSFLKHEKRLRRLLNEISQINRSLLIKTKDLKGSQMETLIYKSNFNWNRDLFFIDYQETLIKSEKIDDWWAYWK